MVYLPIKRTPQLLLLACAVALAGVVAVHAADDRSKDKSKTPKSEDEILKKYDKNANGRLDPDEDAAMKADQAKAERKKKG
jgi:hypothetical protein